MTKLAIPRFNKLTIVPIGPAPINVTTAIINLLAEQPRKVLELAAMLGVAPATVTSRLHRLEAIRQAHRTQITGRQGRHYLWHAGPVGSYVAPLPLDPEIEEEAPGAGQPIRNIVSVYTIDTPRDPWIAAVFGPARKEH